MKKKLKREIKQLKKELERLDNNLAYLKGKLENRPDGTLPEHFGFY